MPVATHLRLRVRHLGGHIHVGVWSGVPGFTYGCCGELTFNEAEWPNMRELLQRGGERVEIIDSAWCPAASDHRHDTMQPPESTLPRCRHCRALQEA